MGKQNLINIILQSFVSLIMIVFFILSLTNEVTGESYYILLAIIPVLGYFITSVIANKNSSYPEEKKRLFNTWGIILVVLLVIALVLFSLPRVLCDYSSFGGEFRGNMLCAIFVGGLFVLLGGGLIAVSAIGYILLFISQLVSYIKLKGK